jgi:hypothetical protein
MGSVSRVHVTLSIVWTSLVQIAAFAGMQFAGHCDCGVLMVDAWDASYIVNREEEPVLVGRGA